MHEKKYMYIKHLFCLIETFMTGVGLEPKQIVVWFVMLVGQFVMFLCVYHAHHLRLKSLSLFSYSSILTLDGSKKVRRVYDVARER